MTRLAVPRWQLVLRSLLVTAAAGCFLYLVVAPAVLPSLLRTAASWRLELGDLARLVALATPLLILLAWNVKVASSRPGTGIDAAGSVTWRAARAPRVLAAAWVVPGVLGAWWASLHVQGPGVPPPELARWAIVQVGAALSSGLMALAVVLPLSFVEAGADETEPADEPATPPAPDDLEPWFWDHTAYRGQIRRIVPLPRRGRPPAARVSRAGRVRRFPVLAEALDRDDWGDDTWRAAEAILAAVAGSSAVALAGWPGSGRARLVGEVAELCRSDQRIRVILVTPDGHLPAGVRFDVEVRAVRGGDGFDATELPEVLACDPEAFARTVARGLVRHQPAGLWGLGLVALLEVDRYGREATLHVREALTRLRTVMLARGRDFAVVVTLAPWDDALALAEAVANRTDVVRVNLVRPVDAQRLVHWEPPPRLDRSRDEIAPNALRSEVVDLVAALAGADGPLGAADRPCRIAVIDPDGVLGPESWEAIRHDARQRLPEGTVAPELAHLVGPALPTPGRPHDAALVLATRPHLRPTLAAARGLVRGGGLLFALEGPGVDLDEEVERMAGHDGLDEAPIAQPGWVVPVAPEGLRRAGWWALLEDLPESAVVPHGRIRDAYGDDAWERLVDTIVREAGLDGIVDEVFVDRGGVIDREPALVRPRDWSVPRAPHVPWGAITLDRLPVRSATASAAETSPAVLEIDRFRLGRDWLVHGIVAAGTHSLRVVEVREGPAGEEVVVGTPGRREAIDRGLLRPWREVAVEPPADGPRVQVRGTLGSPATVELRHGVGAVHERILGHWSSAADLNPDPRRVGEPTRLLPPLEHRFHTWMAILDWTGPGLDDPERARAIVATLLGAWLVEARGRFVGLDDEFAAAVVDGEAGPRWVIHRRYAAPDRAALGRLLPDSGDALQRLLDALHRRLATCRCEDGCPRCCARLGDVPLALVEAGRVPADTPGERISRRAAVAWLREAFGLVEPEAPTLPDIAILRRQVVGTEAAGFRDGILWRLVRDRQAIAPEDLAPAEWMEPDPDEPGLLGLYVEQVGGRNLVKVRRPEPPDGGRFTALQVLVHEYTHNWHHRGAGFDRDAWMRSEAARAWFEGRLVIEGHATWVETLYLLRHGRQPLYRADDLLQWTAYKAGFLLIDWIVRTYGIGGLYRFLAGPEAMDEGPPPARGRTGQAPWPLDLPTAIRLAGLDDHVGAEAPGPSDAIDPAGEGGRAG